MFLELYRGRHSTVGLTGVAKKTVARLFVEVGEFRAEFQYKAF
jgi:hypothetical protein